MKSLRMAIGHGKSRCRVLGGFTLIELLVVVSIIALLVSILLPALSKARVQAKLAVCASQQKQLGTIWFMYADDNSDWLPPSPNGTQWNFIFDFLREELGGYDVTDGKIFYCPDYVPPVDTSTGTVYDWFTPYYFSYSPNNPVYFGGYSLFTNVVYASGGTILKWHNADGTDGSTGGSWQYYWLAADDDLQHIIPPSRVGESTHKASIHGNDETFRMIPATMPMIFDHAASTIMPHERDYVFKKDYCRHLDRTKGKPAAINAVYLDGHVQGRGPTEIGILRMMSGTSSWPNGGPYGTGNLQIWF